MGGILTFAVFKVLCPGVIQPQGADVIVTGTRGSDDREADVAIADHHSGGTWRGATTIDVAPPSWNSHSSVPAAKIHDHLIRQEPAMRLIAVGGSDAGISAALRVQELDPDTGVTVVVAHAYPNFSICGIPYYVSGEVTDWHNLAHRTVADLSATGMETSLDTIARRIDVEGRKLVVTDRAGAEEQLSDDSLVVGTGAASVRPPIDGLVGPNALGGDDGVHLLHSMGDALAVMAHLGEGLSGQRDHCWSRLHRTRDGGGAGGPWAISNPDRATSRSSANR